MRRYQLSAIRLQIWSCAISEVALIGHTPEDEEGPKFNRLELYLDFLRSPKHAPTTKDHMHKLPHICNHCSRSFKRTEHLTRHLRTRLFIQGTLPHLRQG